MRQTFLTLPTQIMQVVFLENFFDVVNPFNHCAVIWIRINDKIEHLSPTPKQSFSCNFKLALVKDLLMMKRPQRYRFLNLNIVYSSHYGFPNPWISKYISIQLYRFYSVYITLIDLFWSMFFMLLWSDMTYLVKTYCQNVCKSIQLCSYMLKRRHQSIRYSLVINCAVW